MEFPIGNYMELMLKLIEMSSHSLRKSDAKFWPPTVDFQLPLALL